jgi:hypothetical protein
VAEFETEFGALSTSVPSSEPAPEQATAGQCQQALGEYELRLQEVAHLEQSPEVVHYLTAQKEADEFKAKCKVLVESYGHTVPGTIKDARFSQRETVEQNWKLDAINREKWAGSVVTMNVDLKVYTELQKMGVIDSTKDEQYRSPVTRTVGIASFVAHKRGEN